MRVYSTKVLSTKVKLKTFTKNGATIILTHGVEAFAPKRHLVKEDDSKVASR